MMGVTVLLVICSHHVSSVPHCLDEPYGGQQEMGQVLAGFWAHHDHHRADAGPNHDQRLAQGEVEEKILPLTRERNTGNMDIRQVLSVPNI